MNKTQMEQDVKIDRFKLEEASQDQAELYYQYTKNLHRLTKKKLKLEKKLTELEAQIDLEIRNKLEQEGETAREGEIKSRITLDKRIKKMRREVINAKVKLQKAEHIKTVFDQRRSMIKYLTELYVSQYWSNDPFAKEEMDRAFDEEMSTSHNRKKRRKEL